MRSTGDQFFDSLVDAAFTECSGAGDHGAFVIDEHECWLTRDVECRPHITGLIRDVREPLNTALGDEALNGIEFSSPGNAENSDLTFVLRLCVGDRTGLPLARRSPRSPEPQHEVLAGVVREIHCGAVGCFCCDIENGRRRCATALDVSRGGRSIGATRRTTGGSTEGQGHQQRCETWDRVLHPGEARRSRSTSAFAGLVFTTRSWPCGE